MPNSSTINQIQGPKADPAWDEASLRVEGYLRSYGLESHVLLNQITAAIIQEARRRADAGESGTPVGLAMDVTQSRIGAWLAQSGQEIDWTNERMRAQGRLALIIADLPRRWPNHFMSPDGFPNDLAAAMASFRILPAPGMRLSNMAPEPLEFGIMEPGDPRLQSRGIWAPMRAVVPWLLIFGFFGVAWASSH
jgi:hypothetical protein